MRPTPSAVLCLISACCGPLAANLEMVDEEGRHLDVVSGGKTLVRYMYAHDTSTPERHHETYKPYLHVFDADGKKPITKGPGGKFTHHRGIFIGWNRIEFDGKRFDRWHMKGGDIVHHEFGAKEADGDRAKMVSRTRWEDGEGRPLLDEERTMVVHAPGGDGVRMVIDFQSILAAEYGDIVLKGDPEHAGIQYRPANEVDVKKTRYFFPKDGVDLKKDRDLPWIAETYVLDGKTHSVVQMNHPDNPRGTRHSAYRDYGRFGSFFEKEIGKGEALKVHYRFLIIDGEMPGREKIDAAFAKFARE